MGLWSRPARPVKPKSREAALACTPIKSRDVSETRLDSGDLLLTYPVRMKPWMSDLLRRFSPTSPEPTRKLQLDELGTATWDLLDGNRSVREVIDSFAGTYRLHPREAEASVTRFLLELGKRGLIAMGQKVD